jgi:hypothetical protein
MNLKHMERPVLGRELENTGLISLFPNRSRRRKLIPVISLMKQVGVA